MTTCRSCGVPVRWIVTASGKRMPVDEEPGPDGNDISHFATCPHAGEWRQR